MLLCICLQWAVGVSSLMAETQGEPRLALVTISPGERIWERFGHDALLITTGTATQGRLYSYGFFDFREDDFFRRFAAGQMNYLMDYEPAGASLARYREDDRPVRIQWLDVPPEQLRALATFLEWNALPDNQRYRYDYYLDNCATRVRNLLDQLADRGLAQRTEGRSRGWTYRMHTLRLVADQPLLWFAMHLGLGAPADRPLSLWEEMFLPVRLAELLGETDRNGQAALPIIEDQLWHAGTPLPIPDLPPDHRLICLLLGLLAAGSVLSLHALGREHARWQRVAALWNSGCLLLIGLLGCVLLALWVLTDHWVAGPNWNLLLVSPIALFALPRRWRHTALALLGVSAGLALFVETLPMFRQANAEILCLFLPVVACLVWTGRRPPARAIAND